MAEERDPYRKSPNTPGAKLDAGKNRLGLVLLDFRDALWEVGRVGTYGATKYSDGGWKQVPDGLERYTDAMLRHLLKEREVIDPESRLLHSACVAWNALARLQLLLGEEGVPDYDRVTN